MLSRRDAMGKLAAGGAVLLAAGAAGASLAPATDERATGTAAPQGEQFRRAVVDAGPAATGAADSPWELISPLTMGAAVAHGWRVAGLPGAVTATLALLMPSLVCVLLFGMVWRRYRNHPGMTRVLAVLRPIVTGLILAVALRLCRVVLGGAVADGEGFQAWSPLLVAGAVCLGVLHGKVSPVLLLLAGAGLGAWLC